MNPERLDKILVVDDTAANLQLLTDLLTEHGYTVYPASDGELALAFVRSTLPHLVLLDIRMPGMDGFEVCRRLKADERTRDIPVIFISALEDQDDKVKGFQAGAVDYVTKPFQADEVLARVRIHLQLRELTEHLEQKVIERTEALRDANAQLQHELAERQKTEQRLKASEKRLRLTLEATQIGIFDWDIVNDRWYASPQYYTMLGYEPKEGEGDRKEWLERVHPDDRDHVEAKIQKVLSRKLSADRSQIYEYKARISHCDGTYRWEHVKGFGIEHDREGRITRVLGVRMDITEQKKAEQERTAHLHVLESISSTSRAIHGSNDLEEMMTDVLDVTLSTFGCDRAFLVYPCDPDAASWSVPMERTRPEYPGPKALDLTIPMDEEVAEVYRIQRSLDGPVKFGPGSEHPLPEKASQQFGIKSLISMALHPKVGKPWQFGMHQCSYARQWRTKEERLFQEIGRRLEDALTSLLSYRNLQESEERYRLVFENSPVSILEEDFSGVRAFLDSLRKQGVDDIESYFIQHPETVQWCADLAKVTDVNCASLALYGAADKDELVKGLIDTFTPESFDYFRNELVRLYNGGTEMKGDTIVKTFSDDLRMVTISFSVCPGYEKTLSKVIVSIDDITERKAAEEALRRLNSELDRRVLNRTEQLEASNKELEAFTYTVSHDLRAPLRHIDGFLKLLQKKEAAVLDKQSRHYMDNISGAAQKMGRLIDELLSFTRMGRYHLTYQQVDIGALVQDVVRELDPDAAVRSVDWRIGDLPAVGCDAALLRTVLVNLISNALKFTQPRQKATIEIGSLPGKNSEAVIFVRDNGVGFDMAHADKLFGVFQRLHHTEQFEGTGIGLANVRRIIARHGGRIWAEGGPDRGATFYFALPQA